jgi:hypothetical protein
LAGFDSVLCQPGLAQADELARLAGMKTIAALVCLLFATSLLQAQTNPPATTPTDTKTPATKPVPGKPPVTKDLKKKPEPEPVIPGITIVRPNGTLLGLEVVGGQFKLSFYDKKKKPMNLDVTRATARWPDKRRPGDNHTVLNPSGSNVLGGGITVVGPFAFNLILNLFQGEGEDAKVVETYVVPFHG